MGYKLPFFPCLYSISRVYAMIYLFLLLLPFNNFELSKNSFLSAMRMQFVIVLSSLTKFDLSLYEIFLDSSRNYKRHRFFFSYRESLSNLKISFERKFMDKLSQVIKREKGRISKDYRSSVRKIPDLYPRFKSKLNYCLADCCIPV